MLSRRTARMIGEAYGERFADTSRVIELRGGGQSTRPVLHQDLYDFLFDRSYPAWLTDLLQGDGSVLDVKNTIMHLHMGEGVNEPGYHRSLDHRIWFGHLLLLSLATHLLAAWNEDLQAKDIARVRVKVDALLRSLELDGYLFKSGQLLKPEEDVLNAEEEANLLQSLYIDLRLANKEIVFNHLSLTEEHYQNAKWGDCISNARSFLEGVLQEVAMAHSLHIRNQPLGKNKYEKADEVRSYLESAGLIDEEERKALAAVFGALSDKGSHPYMAQKDQARLLRQLALVLAQFVMLRFDGLLSKKSTAATSVVQS